MDATTQTSRSQYSYPVNGRHVVLQQPAYSVPYQSHAQPQATSALREARVTYLGDDEEGSGSEDRWSDTENVRNIKGRADRVVERQVSTMRKAVSRVELESVSAPSSVWSLSTSSSVSTISSISSSGSMITPNTITGTATVMGGGSRYNYTDDQKPSVTNVVMSRQEPIGLLETGQGRGTAEALPNKQGATWNSDMNKEMSAKAEQEWQRQRDMEQQGQDPSAAFPTRSKSSKSMELIDDRIRNLRELLHAHEDEMTREQRNDIVQSLARMEAVKKRRDNVMSRHTTTPSQSQSQSHIQAHSTSIRFPTRSRALMANLYSTTDHNLGETISSSDDEAQNSPGPTYVAPSDALDRSRTAERTNSGKPSTGTSNSTSASSSAPASAPVVIRRATVTSPCPANVGTAPLRVPVCVEHLQSYLSTLDDA